MDKSQSGKWKWLTRVAVTVIALSALTSAPAGAGEGTLEECRALKDRIDRYTSLRRMGGSASQMNGWKKQLRKYDARFRELDCSEFRRELRRK